MRARLALGLGLAAAAGPAAGAAPRDGAPVVATVAGGVGLPELVHLEAGWQLRETLALELHAGTVVFNPLVGPALRWTAWGGPRGHQLALTGAARIHPGLRPLRLVGGGETLAATVEGHLGYAFIGERGLLLRARLGALVYGDGGLAIGPSIGLAAGHAFGR